MTKKDKDKIAEVTQRTGLDPTEAKKYLQEGKWNVDVAVQIYGTMRASQLPPTGLQKNQDVKRPAAMTAGGQPTSDGLNEIPNQVGKAVLQHSQLRYPPGSPNHARKMERGMSRTSENFTLVKMARSKILGDICETTNKDGDSSQQLINDSPDYTFVLPDLTCYPADFRAFLHKDLIETSTLVSLEQSNRLNWWADSGACQRLHPLATTGDGNCLLHAASLGMWGFHDRLLTLRSALFNTLDMCQKKGAMYRRWRWQQMETNQELKLEYSESEWLEEWSNLLKLASTKPRTAIGSDHSCCSSPATKGLMERNMEKEEELDDDVFYESLEEFHVYVLASILQRPIIVVADTILRDSNGEALAPIPFGGIYLPLECDPLKCHRNPLLLTYDASHFSALVAMETPETSEEAKIPAAIPIVDPENRFQLLTMHYAVDPGVDFEWGVDDKDPEKLESLRLSETQKLEVVKKYLDICQMPIPNGSDHGSEPRSRSNSIAWSLESGDDNTIPQVTVTQPSNHASGKDKEKDKATGSKEKDKSNKKAKQVQNVHKGFGSIGKNISKAFKNPFAGKKNKADGTEKKHFHRIKSGSITQSTKLNNITMEMLKDKDSILCVKLIKKRAEFQETLVQNYLQAAKQRFQTDREMRSRNDLELRKKAEQRKSCDLTDGAFMMQCVNTGCAKMGSAATSYLCPECFEKEKQQALDFEKRPSTGLRPPSYQPQSSSEILREKILPSSHTIPRTKIGNSKFYTALNNQTMDNSNIDSRNSAHLNNQFLAPTSVSNRPKSDPAGMVDTVNDSIASAAKVERSSYIVNDLHVPKGIVKKDTNRIGALSGPALRHPDDNDEDGEEDYENLCDARTGNEQPGHFTAQVNINLVSPVPAGNGQHITGELPLGSSRAPQHQFMNKIPNDQKLCKNKPCDFFGTQSNNGFCSSCYKKQTSSIPYQAVNRSSDAPSKPSFV